MDFKEVVTHPVPHIRIENVFSDSVMEELKESMQGELVLHDTPHYRLFHPTPMPHLTIKETYSEVFENKFEIAKSLGASLDENGVYSERGNMQGYEGPDTYTLHLDTLQKVMTSVVYISPEDNVGTRFYENGDGHGMYEDPWKVNCGYIFCRSDTSWHNYLNPQNNIRWVAMYNIMLQS
jgi:hypothetical protein